jgi:hypothetical protein
VANDEGYDTPHNTTENDCPNIPAALKPLERHMPLMPYVRESRRIIAMHTLTSAQTKRSDTTPILPATQFRSSIAVGEYGTDLHNCWDNSTFETDLGESRADWSHGGPFQVPFESLVPEVIDGFLAAEKNIGVSRLMNGSTRLQPITMATGQAVGALAALSVKKNLQPRAVRPIDVQREMLRGRSGLSVHFFGDVPQTHARWADVQLATAVVLAQLLKLPLAPLPAAPTFGDVPASDPTYAFVEAFAKGGFTSGCGGGNFCPGQPTDRRALAIFLAKGLALDLTNPPNVATFSDAPVGSPAFAQIEAVTKAGLVPACGGTTFCPTQAVTRGELAFSVARVLER